MRTIIAKTTRVHSNGKEDDVLFVKTQKHEGLRQEDPKVGGHVQIGHTFFRVTRTDSDVLGVKYIECIADGSTEERVLPASQMAYMKDMPESTFKLSTKEGLPYVSLKEMSNWTFEKQTS
jgi:hypothetical protein